MLENAGKIANLFRGSKEERQTALVLLDSLIDFARDAGIQREFAEKVEVFNGMSAIGAGGTFPIPSIYHEIFLQKESANQEEAFIIEEDLIVPLWDLYFRLFPEKLETLPSKIKISHCHKVPSFCGPESHIRGIEFMGPTFGVDGLEKCTQLVRVHFSLGWLDNGWATQEKSNHLSSWLTSDQWINAHTGWYHDNFQNRTQATVDQWFPRLMSMPNIRHYFDEMSTFDDQQRSVSAEDIPNLVSTNLRVRDLHKSKVLYNAFRPNWNVKCGYNYPQAYSHLTVRRETSEGLQIIWRKNDNNSWTHFQHDTAIDIPRTNAFTKERIDWEMVIDADLGNVFANTTYTLKLNDQTDKPLHLRLLQFEGDTRHIFSNTLDFPNLQIAKFANNDGSDAQRIVLNQAWLSRCPRLEAASFENVDIGDFNWNNSHYHNEWYAGVSRVFASDFFYAEHPLRFLSVAILEGYFDNIKKVQLSFSGTGALHQRLHEMKSDLNFISRFKIHLQNVSRVVVTNLGHDTVLDSLTSFKSGTKVVMKEGWLSDFLLTAPDPFTENYVSPTLPEHALYHKKEIPKIHNWQELELWFARILEGHYTMSDVRLSPHLVRLCKKRFAKNDVPETFAKVLNGRSHIRIGNFWLFHIDGQWSLKERRHLKNFDEEYCTRGQKVSIKYWRSYEYQCPRIWNLQRAYYARPYSDGTLPKFLDKAQYNTKKVPLSALQSKSELNTLKVEVSLDRSDFVELSKLDQIRYLYLNKQGLSNVPLEVCQMENLKHLFLSDNDLSDLPTELSNLSDLEILGLTKNSLNAVPTVLDDLPNLKKLYISQTVYNNFDWSAVEERGIKIQVTLD